MGALLEKVIIPRESRKNALSFHNKNPKWPKLSDSVPLSTFLIVRKSGYHSRLQRQMLEF